jgi:hypothetical protein
MTLYNEDFDRQSSVSIAGYSGYIPKSSMAVSFGQTLGGQEGLGNLALKEVRLWKKSLAQKELARSRRLQIDPTVLSSEKLL